MDILYVDMPYVEIYGSKKRPVLCLTKPVTQYNLVVVAFITTKVEENISTNILISSDDDNFADTGLKHTSSVCLHKISTLSLKSIQGKIGTLPKNLTHEVQQKLKNYFDL